MESLVEQYHWIFGVAFLLLGPRLLWISIGIAGFMGGLELAQYFFPAQSSLMMLAIAGGVAVLAVIMTVLIQKIAIVMGGFLLGGFVGVNLAASFGFSPEQMLIAVFLVSGIIGAILAQVIFEWALMILSAALGAFLILKPINFNASKETLWFFGLLLLGLSLQKAQAAGLTQDPT